MRVPFTPMVRVVVVVPFRCRLGLLLTFLLSHFSRLCRWTQPVVLLIYMYEYLPVGHCLACYAMPVRTHAQLRDMLARSASTSIVSRVALVIRALGLLRARRRVAV